MTWLWFPKFICSKIWLERNNWLFREEARSVVRVASKVRTFLGEALQVKVSLRNANPLEHEEEGWLKELDHNLLLRPNLSSSMLAPLEIRLAE